MDQISICICTKNRKEGLSRLLLSLERVIIPDGVKVKIVVVENDLENKSEDIVKNFAKRSRFVVNYYLEQSPGLSYARNRSVKEAGDCSFCCFIDDDQEADIDWLKELVNCQREFHCDGVWGANPPVFNKKVPSYIRKFYTPKPFSYGQITEKAFTNSLLIRKKCLDKIEGPFDIRLNFCGGEDRLMTFNVTREGGVIRCNQKAKAFEIIPENRSTIHYIMKRAYRISNAGFYISSLENKNFQKWKILPKLMMRFFYGIILFLPSYFIGGEDKLLGLIKIINACGGFAYILGSKNEFYKN